MRIKKMAGTAVLRGNVIDSLESDSIYNAPSIHAINEKLKNLDPQGGGAAEGDKVGSIKLFGGSAAPEGWLMCDGSAVSRTTYSDLFNIIGTTYGAGNGSTTFNIPNIKGKTVVGLDLEDTDFNTLGATSGEKTNTLTLDNLPKRTGYINNLTLSTGAGGAALGTMSGWKASALGDGGETYNKTISNLQPYIVLNYIIKAVATTPTSGNIVDSLEGDSTTDAPSVHAVNDKIKNFEAGDALPTNSVVGFSGDESAIPEGYEVISEEDFTFYSDQVPIGTELDYNGTTVPAGYEQIEDTAESNDYFLDEKVIGTFLGKPLYRKVITVTDSAATSVDISSLKTDFIMYDKSVIDYLDSNSQHYIRHPYNYSGTEAFLLFKRDNSIQIRKTNIAIATFKKIELILEYTKTTD